MTIGLNIECLAEGVEKEEQVIFLRDIGCMKLQGYYYCKPVPLNELLRRYQTGIAIGFENPEESAYFESVGRVNLFDISSIAGADLNTAQRFFDTLPMAVIEVGTDHFRIVRCNKTYRESVRRHSPGTHIEEPFPFSGIPVTAFYNAMRQCVETKSRIVIDEADQDGTMVHAILRYIGKNPVTGLSSMAVGVLSLNDPADTKQAVTYANIAKALSADYAYLYYINLSSDQFVEFSSGSSGSDLSVERHGTDFFTASICEAKSVLYPEDYEEFARIFTRENVLRSLEEHGSFICRYRMMTRGQPHWVLMKINRMPDDPDHIIIGISDIDAQVRQQAAFDRMTEESLIYARISALAGNYTCICTVDPETGNYREFKADSDFAGLGFTEEGDRYFERVKENSRRTVHPDDLDRLLTSFTRENVLKTIETDGSYAISCRLRLGDTFIPVRLKAVMVTEKGHPQLIIGISRIKEPSE